MKQIYKMLLITLLGILCITGCGTKESSKNKIEVLKTDHIDVTTSISHDKEELIVFMTNKNNYNIGNFNVKAVYYDKDGKKIDEDESQYFDFKSMSDYVVSLRLPQDDNYDAYVPEKIEISVEIDQEYQELVGETLLYNESVETSYQKREDELAITLKNRSNKELESVEVAVLYMKNNQPIAIEEISCSLGINENKTETVDIPIDWEKSIDEDVFIQYDAVKIVVNVASEE